MTEPLIAILIGMCFGGWFLAGFIQGARMIINGSFENKPHSKRIAMSILLGPILSIVIFLVHLVGLIAYISSFVKREAYALLIQWWWER